MPQLDFSTFPSQLFWLWLSFCSLWAVMQFFVLPPLKKLFSRREGYILELVNRAKALQAEAREVRTAAEEGLLQAQQRLKQEMQQEMNHVQDKIREEKERLNADLHQRLQEKMPEIERAHRALLKKSESTIEELTQSIEAKIHDRFVFSGTERQ